MKFAELVGHSDTIGRIKNLIDNDRIPHALLLHGPSGSGKLAIARAMAQYIHCEHKTDFHDSCGICPSCIQHQTFNHADLFFSFPIVKKKNTKSPTSDDFIEEWRQFLSENKYESIERWATYLEGENAQPKIYVNESAAIIHRMNMESYSSRYKILIMWLPERMNEECANKLLKLIEEPYPNTLFILVSNSPREVLPTIYSRTQRIEISKFSTEEIANYLANNFGIDYQQAIAIAAPADGDMVMAQAALSLDSENQQFFEVFMQIMRMAYIRDIKGLKDWSENIASYKREKERRFLQYCVRMLRENFIYNFKINGLNYMTQKEEQFSQKFSPFINERNVIQMVEEFERAEIDIVNNANARIVLFDLALHITKLIKN